MKEFKDKYKLNNKEHKNTFTLKELLIITSIFGVVVCIFTTFIVVNVTKNNVFDKNLNDIVKSYKEITSTYYEKVDSKNLADSAIDGMLEYLNENYSKYLDSEETESLTDSLSDSYKGIGIVVYDNGTNYVLYNVVKDSESYKAGLKKNDILKQVNDTVITRDIKLDDISKMINESNKVKIVVERNSKELTFNVDVKNVALPVANYKILNKNDSNIGYIYLSSFSKNAYNQFKDALETIEHTGIDSLIIDLRDNTGGHLVAAEQLTSIFLDKTHVIYQIQTKEETTKYYSTSDKGKTYPVAILVNENSASASEIFAIAMQEEYKAIIVGKNTFGKGTVQEVNSLNENVEYKVTTKKWLSPKGNWINEVGVKPDIDVDLKENKDTQKDAAINALLK